MKLTLLLVTLFITLHSSSVEAVQAKQTEIHDKINQVLEQHNFQGSALITKNSIPIHHQGRGMAVMEWNIPNSPTIKFRIASLSKTFTATLLMMMIEEGRLQLDTPVSEFLPEFPTEHASQITIEHLLTHRTGIPRLFKIPGWSNDKSLVSMQQTEFLTIIAALPLEFEPGTSQLYSSANYYILGAIIERITGKAFGVLLHEKILQPLNMQETDVYRTGQPVDELANAYKPVAGEYSFCPAVSGDFCTGNNINLALFTASGSMHSTTKDLLIWLQTLEKNLLLNKTSKAFLLNSENRAGWDSQTLVLADNKPRKVVIASGELEGNSALLVNLPEERISIILLSKYGMTYSQIAAVALEIIYMLLSV